MLTVEDVRELLRLEALQPRRRTSIHEQPQKRIPRMMVELRKA
jgi:tRNA1(Val) A37 N6-methylase TrmN6